MRDFLRNLLGRRFVRTALTLSVMGSTPGLLVGVVWSLVTRQFVMTSCMLAAWIVGGLLALPTLREVERESSDAT